MRGIKAGQSTLEYAVLAICLVAALLAMAVYIKRGMQGRLRQSGDELGEQYSPGNTSGVNTIVTGSHTFTIGANLNEQQIHDDCIASGESESDCFNSGDLNKNGTLDKDVYALNSATILLGEGTVQKGNEVVGPLEKKLY